MSPARSWARHRQPVPCPSPQALAVLALVTATALWGSSFVAAKVLLRDVPPVTLAFLRFALAAAVLVPLAYRRGGRPLLGWRSALLGVIGIALFFLCQNAGLRHASATDATLIMGGGLPALTALFAAGLPGERPTRRQVGGLVVSLAGVAAVAWVGHGGVGASAVGNGLLLIAAASGAAYTVLGRQVFAGPGLFGALAGGACYGLLALGPAVAVELAATGVSRPGPLDVLLLLHLGVGCSAVAFALWAYSLRRLTATQSAIIGNVELPIGVTAAALLLGEGLASGQVVGGGLVLLGAWLAIEATGAKQVPVPISAAHGAAS